MEAVEIYTVDEYDRRVSETEELGLTGQSRTTRWKLTREGKYPPKGALGPWLSEVLSYCADPDNYRYHENGESVVSDDADRPDVKVRKVRRRRVRSA